MGFPIQQCLDQVHDKKPILTNRCIAALLHFNDNDYEEGMQNDSLHKIHPLLNILKITLGKHATFGSELSLDEAAMANKSSYARFLICFNPMKPTGKFHF
jgi:hypothetical protein